MADTVSIREIGLRDGLQMVASVLPTERKLAWCRAAMDAGVREIEATSFVPAHILPQFADAAEVVRGAQAMDGALISTLVLNLKGAQRAFDAGVRKITYVVSASEAHSLANVRRTTEAALAGFGDIAAERKARGLAAEVSLGCAVATAFGCTIQGEVPEARVIEMAGRLADDGADEIVIADTVGYANPRQVRRMFDALPASIGDVPLAGHFHDTRGLGLANVAAALDAGVRRFDAAMGGLGGCPFAPGATGNVNTEDCAYLLEEMGFDTGIDIEALVRLRATIETWLPDERFAGAISRAGLPRTFRDRRAASA